MNEYNDVVSEKIIRVKNLLKDIKLGNDYKKNSLEIKYAESNKFYIICTTPGHETKELKSYKKMVDILKIVL